MTDQQTKRVERIIGLMTKHPDSWFAEGQMVSGMGFKIYERSTQQEDYDPPFDIKVGVEVQLARLRPGLKYYAELLDAVETVREAHIARWLAEMDADLKQQAR